MALEGLEGDEVLLILGKGDEDYQEIKGVKYPFDDRAVARELLQEQNV
jgi:UDP-N-acetylmuramoyl-L-alanyl-D-glutamate--2,6-diaminopimelate ligase